MEDFGWLQYFSYPKLPIYDFGWLQDFSFLTMISQFKILADVKIFAFQNNQFKIQDFCLP